MPCDAARSDATEQLRRAWTLQLYREYDALLYRYGLSVRPPGLRIAPMVTRWGTWDARLRVITLSTALIEQHTWDIVVEVLKHEVAHQIVSEMFHAQEGHGPQFKRACAMLGLSGWAAQASGELPVILASASGRALSHDQERLLKKVEKLLSLATSSNEHEAVSAMQRVQEIYAKHNLQQARTADDTPMRYVVIDTKRKRIDKAESMIFSILVEHFFVRAIYGKQFDSRDLCEYRTVELLGAHENVAMAEYVYHFLWRTMHTLWDAHRTRTGVHGRAKGSYMLGVAMGFRSKLETHATHAQDTAAQGLSAVDCRALVHTANARVEAYVQHRHPRLRKRILGGAGGYAASYEAGVADGNQVNLNKGIHGSSTQRGLLLDA